MRDDKAPGKREFWDHDYRIVFCPPTRPDRNRQIGAAADTRQTEALRLVAFQLQQLGLHVTSARGILNDLRMLRRVLLGEHAAVRRSPPRR